MPDLLQPDLQELAAAGRPIDPYLWLAEASGYADHGGAAAYAEGVDITVRSTVKLADAQGLVVWSKVQAADGECFLTARVTRAALAGLLQQPKVQVALAAPLVPQRPAGPWRTPALSRTLPLVADPAEQGGARGGTLIGIVDDGCPFAHADLLAANGATRILRLWDQGGDAPMCGLEQAAAVPYGRVRTRAHLQAIMEAVRGPDGRVDEHACYLLSGQGATLARRSHGAHSLGLLAGRRLWRARPGVPAAEVARVQAEQQASVSSDIVFVQLPQAVLRCVSVAALAARAFDAVAYILAVARERECSRVVLSFSFESWVGPHDGTDWFCRGTDALLDSAAACGLSVQLHMPAGNTRARRAHLVNQQDGRTLEFGVQVHPDNEVPTFVELWLDERPDIPVDLRLTLVSPRGWTVPTVRWGEARGLDQAMVVMRPAGAGPNMVLVRIGPTRLANATLPAAPAGRWGIRLEADDPRTLQNLHAYIGRAEETLGAPRRGRQAHFTGRTEAEALADQAGTLNGHAMGRRTTVSGAYYRWAFPYRRPVTPQQDVAVADYSSQGPGRTGRVVDQFVAVDDGLALPGSLSIGNRSATVVRMQGTSLAAPLLARRAVDQVQPPPGAPSAQRPAGPYDPFA